MKEHFAQRLRELRTEKKFSQAALAKQLGVSQVSYLHWEQGKTQPSIDNICALCVILDTSSDYLLGLSDY